jgi:CRISPR/Cas system CMR-associated protein Cmr5 small subunit
MKNLEQIRARNALALANETNLQGKQGGDMIKKVPSLILNHGLLATAAFSYSEKNDAWVTLFGAITKHLADPEIAIFPPGHSTRDQLMSNLTGKDATSDLLKRATAETMAWLAFARRFVKKSKALRDEDEREDN